MFNTTEYNAKDDDGNVTSTVRAYVVTEDDVDPNHPQYVTTTGGAREVRVGDVLISDGNPNYWDVMDQETWSGLGYEEANAGNGGSADVLGTPGQETAAPVEAEQPNTAPVTTDQSFADGHTAPSDGATGTDAAAGNTSSADGGVQ